MRTRHLNFLTKKPAAAQDPIILKLEGLTTWFQILLDIQRTSLWKEIPDPDLGGGTGTGGTGGTGGFGGLGL